MGQDRTPELGHLRPKRPRVALSERLDALAEPLDFNGLPRDGSGHRVKLFETLPNVRDGPPLLVPVRTE